MKTPSRALRVAIAIAVLTSLLAASFGSVMAQSNPGTPGRENDSESSPERNQLENAVYFPWVSPSDGTLQTRQADGNYESLGHANSMVSVQNLSDLDTTISFHGAGSGDAYLARYASKTFTAAELGVGAGGPVWVTATHAQSGYLNKEFNGWEEWTQIYPEDSTSPYKACLVLTEGNDLPNPLPPDYESRRSTLPDNVATTFIATMDIGPYSYTRWILNDSNVWVTQDVLGVSHAEGDWVVIDNPFDQDNWLQLQTIFENVNGGPNPPLDNVVNPFGGLVENSACNARVTNGKLEMPTPIGGVVLSAVNGGMLPFTTNDDTAVSGYNGLNGWEVFRFDEWYLPIVQTNCGPGGCWNSVVRVAAIGGTNNAVTVRFFPADDGSGSLQTGFQIQMKLNDAETRHINMRDYVPEGWVGSAHIYSDGAVIAMVDRFKIGENMWITNTGSSADFENVAQTNGPGGVAGDYVLFAPHVLIDYFGWNTGINVANLTDKHNNVSLQYFNLFGNASQGQTKRLAPHGMTYFYDPTGDPQDWNEQNIETDFNHDIVGSALIWSDYPVAAVVDATKYAHPDNADAPGARQATSYSATQNLFTAQAIPYVSKGTIAPGYPNDGGGAISGINIMNPHPEAATVNVHWVNQSGFNAANFGVSSVSIPGFANGFVYTLAQHNLPLGFYGAAQVISNLPVAAVSANVNYGVAGDGAAIINGFNPCGFFRTPQGDPYTAEEIGKSNPNCLFGSVLGGVTGTANMTFTTGQEGVQGVWFKIVRTNFLHLPYERDGHTGADGRLTIYGVPEGEYDLIILGPASLENEFTNVTIGAVHSSFTISAGGTISETLTLIPNP